MRILVIGLRGFPDIQGGVEKHAEHLYPLLVRLGCEIDVIARAHYIPAEINSWKGVRFHRLWTPRIHGIEAFFHSFLSVIYAAVLRPDILHIHAIGPAIMTPLARLLGLRVVVTHHGPDYDREKWGYLARGLLRLGERLGMRYAHQRIVISEVIWKLVKDQYGVNSLVIPNGVELPMIQGTTDTLGKFGLEKDRYVLMVSRFVPEKRHLDLLRAFKAASLPGWKLVLVGNADHADEYYKKVVRESREIPGAVLTGFQSGLPLSELYANASMFVLPSSHEGLPIAMLEALSYGLPVIASNIPANLEIGLQSNHYFPLGDTSRLAQKLNELSMKRYSPGEREKIRIWVVNKYAWKAIAQRTYDVYTTMLRS